MNTDRFFTLLTDIDDKYIEEAENYKAKTSKLPVFISIAASALVLAGIAVTAVKLQKAGPIGTDETVPETAVIESAVGTFIGYIENNAAFARLHLLNYLQGEYPDDTVILSVTPSDNTNLSGCKGGYMPDKQYELKAALSKATAHIENKEYQTFPWEDMRPIEVYYRHDGTTDNWIVASDGSLWREPKAYTTEYDPLKNNYIPKEHANELVALVMESYKFLEIDPISPDQIGEIQHAEMDFEDIIFTLDDKQELRELREKLTTAEPTAPSECSWCSLKLELESGQIIYISLSHDGNAIWHSDGKYYRYGSPDKADELFQLFGIFPDRTHQSRHQSDNAQEE